MTKINKNEHSCSADFILEPHKIYDREYIVFLTTLNSFLSRKTAPKRLEKNTVTLLRFGACRRDGIKIIRRFLYKKSLKSESGGKVEKSGS